MSRVRRILLRVMLCIAIALVVVLAVGAWLVRADPSWYRTVHLTDSEQAAAERRLLDRLSTLRNSVGLAQAATRQSRGRDLGTFDIDITEAEVNGPLERWTQGGPFTDWTNANPQAKAAIDQIQEPHIRFLPGRIVFAGRSTSLGSLVSIELTVEQSKDGLPLVTLGRPWAGRMPLSRSIIEDPARRGIDALRAGHGLKVPTPAIDAAAKLVDGEATTPVIVVASSTEGSGLIAARVEKLTVEDGVLHATLRPIVPSKHH